MKIQIRNALPGDVPFVMHSWITSWAKTRTYTERNTPMWRALAGHRGVVERITEAFPPRVAFVDEPGLDGGLIVGWLCGERQGATPELAPGVVHYVYVKHKFRGHGVMRALLADLGPIDFCSSNSRAARKLSEKASWGFAPGLLFYPLREEEHAAQEEARRSHGQR